MTRIRKAHCSCGTLSVETQGEPALVAVCHCIECQRRTGSAFGVSVWFKNEQVRSEGKSQTYGRTAQENRTLRTEFCPNCGTSLYWQADLRPGMTAIALGAFGDPDFTAPSRSIWETNRHKWVEFSCELVQFPEAATFSSKNEALIQS